MSQVLVQVNIYNENELQNISVECKKFVNSLRKEFHQNKINEFLENIKNKKVLVLGKQ